jgi:translation initiation factor 2-alpha kinase 4
MYNSCLQTSILKMLMNHDPSQRPTSAELLKSEYMPPPQLEEAEQNEILRSTISDPHSKAYKRLINGLFSQTMTSADDHLYNSDFHKVWLLFLFVSV